MLAAVLAYQSGGGGHDRAAISSADVDAAPPAPAGEAGGADMAYDETAANALGSLSRDGAVAEQGKSATPALLPRSVIRTGSLRVESEDPAESRRDALQLVTGLGGSVAEEQSTSDDEGTLRRVDLTVRVPSASFDKALEQLGELGTVVDLQQAAEDVSTQVIDIAARIKAQAASVESIRNLLSRATSIRDIVSIESQLTRRQAELDSLTQQQRYLKDQTSLSTIAVTLVKPGKKVEKEEPRDGFLGGLESGWEALGDSAEAIAKAVGAALPFAGVLLLLVGGYRLVRRG